MVEIRQATVEDVGLWRALRRDGIERYPEAFMLSLAGHDASDPADDARRLASGGKFLAFEGDTAVGMIGHTPYTSPSMRHRAEIGPLYVIPDHQGTPLAKRLMQTVVDHACGAGIWQLELTVNEANTRATAFYQREGFTGYGRLPNAVIGANGPEHDLLLLRLLPSPA